MWSRAELKENAKFVLRRSYWVCFLVCLAVTLISGNLSSSGSQVSHTADGLQDGWQAGVSGFLLPYFQWNNIDLFDMHPLGWFTGGMFLMIALIALIVSLALSLFVFNPLKVGKVRYFIRNVNEEASFSDVWSVFTDGNYLNIVKVMLVKDVKLFLWTLLLIIPGIYKGYQYQMIPYILAEDSATSMEDCFDKTKMMTQYQKFDIFVLDLSFIGWYFLGGLFFGIGGIFVDPYKTATDVELYL